MSGAPPLVLLHPLGVDGAFWRPVSEALRSLWKDAPEVLTPDLLGHGSAPLPPLGASVAAFADAVIDGLPPRPVDLVGVSLGGLVAQQIAGDRPELVRRLVLVDTVTKYGEPMRQSWRDRTRAARQDGLAGLAEPMATTWFTDAFRDAAPDRVAGIRETFLGMRREGYARTCETLENADTTDLAKRIAAPSLVICGDKDAPPFVEAARWFAENLGCAQLTWLDGRHAVALERPEAFAAVLHDFLA